MQLPDWFSGYRDNQFQTIAKVVNAFKSVDLIILDAPTGSGKTLIAESVRQLGKFKKTAYVCNTKTLQDQFMRDFPYAKLLKGRSNYPVSGEWMEVTAADCNYDKQTERCSWCDRKSNCPYEIAKGQAVVSELAVLNTSYFLTECNHIGLFKNRDLVIVDEADTLENELMGFVSLDIPAKRVRELGLGEPGKVTKPESWMEWADQAAVKINKAIDLLPEEYDTSNVREVRKRKGLWQLYADVVNLRHGLDNEGWVYTGKDGNVSFKPVKVDGVGKKNLWQHGKKWLLMSATIISPHEMVESLGYEGNWEFIEMGSSFPVENRPVKIMPIADMSSKVNERELCGKAIESILSLHPVERTLIHSVSYDLTKWLGEYLQRTNRPVFSYANGRERDAALRQYERSTNGILIAPSMDRGVDLPDELCRVTIIAKCPFGNLGDRQISSRLFGTRGGQTWYAVNTIRSIIQMTGRGVRHKDDHATTYILDKQFMRLWSDNFGLFPKWWADSLVWREMVKI